MDIHSSLLVFVAILASIGSGAASAGEKSITLHGQVSQGLSKIQGFVTSDATNLGDPLCTTFSLDGATALDVEKTVSATVNAQGAYQLVLPLNAKLALDLFNICKTVPVDAVISVYDAALPGHEIQYDNMDGSFMIAFRPSAIDGPNAVDLSKLDNVLFRPELMSTADNLWSLATTFNGSLLPETPLLVSVDGSEASNFAVDLVLGPQ